MTAHDCNPSRQTAYGTLRRRGPLARWATFRSIARSRRALAQLDNAQLNDIGLTRAEAEAEARRPAWDAPEHWFD